MQYMALPSCAQLITNSLVLVLNNYDLPLILNTSLSLEMKNNVTSDESKLKNGSVSPLLGESHRKSDVHFYINKQQHDKCFGEQ